LLFWIVTLAILIDTYQIIKLTPQMSFLHRPTTFYIYRIFVFPTLPTGVLAVPILPTHLGTNRHILLHVECLKLNAKCSSWIRIPNNTKTLVSRIGWHFKTNINNNTVANCTSWIHALSVVGNCRKLGYVNSRGWLPQVTPIFLKISILSIWVTLIFILNIK